MLEKLTTPLYPVYERLLWRQIREGPIPNHVGIIPDGNRRWARSNNSSVNEAYMMGYKKLKSVLIWLLELGVKNVTVFALSTENCTRRSRSELDLVMNYIKRGLEELLTEEFVDKFKIKVRAIGKLEMVSQDLRKTVEVVTERSSKYSERKLTLAICYGGRQEILDAVSRLVRERKDISSITEDEFRKYFYDNELSDIDLVIRTSGEMRISNFLLWHLAYSELFFCEAYWPDFRKIDLWRAIRAYQRRVRRFGA
ncbi:undecaprenyl diphosphate synthase [Metallosphaera yellowstonensis MK1]|jgi:tritrans,polycis-undecaprenyl-diphosphate synthase [geranylgeranyl-diphosphate specific]|uniref:Tritrans,polycis-undecaprenyl-diphosphate synthase (geranylgeranyl-diphosphate specific) n=1 Tax=Metallosphaera yellowstonensis MK1 TaxID=671065 RepID=H2C621_9CREN|nr:polyprenyl diphosphate synthase [Metallosphaera yellowstonensis]EHP69248.1 undecaprenyl diphosphate synthase [Metallosphaera yellowstonensis MK1]